MRLHHLITILIGNLIAITIVAEDDIDYIRQIKPLLIEHCADCHNADLQESGYRVDIGALLVRGGDHGSTVIAGKPNDSLLILALRGSSKVPQMPLDLTPLSTQQIDLIAEWVEQGAKLPDSEKVDPEARRQSDHWAFQPIVRPTLPSPKNKHLAKNPIDLFVLAKLQDLGLDPSPRADRNTLIRRLYLDLLGIGPTIEQINKFVGNNNPAAYEELVEEILASPRYGERWGRHWLDLARYADSNGFTVDGSREIWKYREWVINALNQDMPFNQFTKEQMAGDLLPDHTTDQLIATGFHRNTLINQEGGTSDEQFRVEAVVDRVNTTSGVYLGLTIGCAQCHQHKFDPISQRDFYELYAIFNNCADNNDAAGSGPIINVPSQRQIELGKSLQTQLTTAETPLAKHDKQFAESFSEWKENLAKADAVNWNTLQPELWTTTDGSQLNIVNENQLLVDFSIPANDTFTVHYSSTPQRITAIRLEPKTHSNLPLGGPGRASNGNFVLTEFKAYLTTAEGTRKELPIARAIADHSQDGYPIYHAIDNKDATGWAINMKSGNANVNREATFFLAEPIDISTTDKLTIELEHAINDKYLIGCFAVSTTSTNTSLLQVPASIQKLIKKEKRTKDEDQQIDKAYKQTDLTRTALVKVVDSIKAQLNAHKKSIPSTMILRELEKPRTTHIQIRGDYLRTGAVVQPAVPAVLPPITLADRSINRLDFAQWLTNDENPLTARVTVNRYWQRFFGLGIVETENDFGTQGSTPSHPALLDWLASEFRDNHWGIKSLHRLIVTSATYQQTSVVSAELIARDPRNRLLARQSRIRLEAEAIRDSSIQTAGVLSTKIGGRGVYPPQPAGIYVLTQQKKAWPESQGDDRFRRGMYTFFWRSSPYPLMPTFDAPEASVTCTRRSRSNTPLQALTLANDRSFFEFAQLLAEKILQSDAISDVDRIRLAMQRTLARNPTPFEQNRLQVFIDAQKTWFSKNPQHAKTVAPDFIPSNWEVSDAAAWTALSRVLLNLDEFITRE
jgi:mono/diheme cytochrome c family protein